MGKKVKRSKRSVFTIIVIVVLALLAVSSANAQDVETITLGVAQPFTGPLGSFGQDFTRGIELAVAQMNAQLEASGSNIRFEVSSVDTEGTPDGAARAVQTIVQSTNAEVIVGPLTTSEVLGAKQYADDNGIVIVAPASSGLAGAIPGDNIFRVMNPPDNFTARAFAELAKMRGYSGIAILTVDDPFGSGMVDTFPALFGGEVNVVTYAPDPTDLSSEATALSANVASLGDNAAVFCICYLADAQKLLQVAQLDPVLGSVDWLGAENLANAELLQDSGAADFLRSVNFTSFSASERSTPLTPLFVDSFTEEYGNPPGPFTNYAFDAANIAMLSILAVGNDGDAVKEFLPFVANHYVGTQVQTYLDENGDQAIAYLGVKVVSPDEADFIEVGQYDGASNTVTLDG